MIILQIQKQFPLAFEFNEYYTRFLAYHSVSCRFRTFLLDCEAQREELGIAAAEDKRGSLNSRQRVIKLSLCVKQTISTRMLMFNIHFQCVETGVGGSDDESIYPSLGMGSGLPNSGSGGSKTAPLGQSVFDYIEKQNQRSPIFFNFLYTPDFERPVSDLKM